MMQTRLVVPDELWLRLRRHLLRDWDEHLAFILAGVAEANGDQILLARHLLPIEDQELEGNLGLHLDIDALLRIMNEANAAGLALVEAHNHPGADQVVGFSAIDLDGQRELVSYLRDVLPGRPYGAIVLGDRSVDGLIWPKEEMDPIQLDEVRILGDARVTLSAPPRADCDGRGGLASGERFHRQILALGEDGQRELRKARVAIVGAGGLGSAVGQQLAHLGVGWTLVIDDDLIDETNLHRQIGATTRDVGRPKAEVVAGFMRGIYSGIEAIPLVANVCSQEALDALKSVDAIFGCVDTDAGRMILNELALAYLVPYIDSGVGIEVQGGTIREAGGKVSVWMPRRPCAYCCRDFSARIAAEELESPVERDFRRRHGYVEGANLPAPAVVSLNGTIASLAVNEFLALVTSLRSPNHYTYYDLLEGRCGRRLVRRQAGCPACASQGLGDRANLERYSPTGLPTDVPVLEDL